MVELLLVCDSATIPFSIPLRFRQHFWSKNKRYSFQQLGTCGSTMGHAGPATTTLKRCLNLKIERLQEFIPPTPCAREYRYSSSDRTPGINLTAEPFRIVFNRQLLWFGFFNFKLYRRVWASVLNGISAFSGIGGIDSVILRNLLRNRFRYYEITADSAE